MARKYKLKVTMQAGNDEGKLQKIIFEQVFDTKKAQLLMQAETFPAIRKILEDWGIRSGAEAIAEIDGETPPDKPKK